MDVVEREHRAVFFREHRRKTLIHLLAIARSDAKRTAHHFENGYGDILAHHGSLSQKISSTLTSEATL